MRKTREKTYESETCLSVDTSNRVSLAIRKFWGMYTITKDIIVRRWLGDMRGISRGYLNVF